MEKQFSGFGGHQNHDDGEGTVGTYGKLFSGTASRGLRRTSELSAHGFRQANARKPEGVEALQRQITAEDVFV